MIKAGLPEEGLQAHQQEAYKNVTNSLKTGNRSAVVIPTGCGKSFISLQLLEDNREKNILFIAPTIAIKNQMYKYIAKYVVGEEPTEERTERQIADEHFPNLKIMLYPTLLRMDNEMLEKLKPDVIIMDELHRTGADKWGPKVNTLLETYSEAKVLGLTATPDRMDDKNVVDDLFEGNISYELTLVEAIKRGIVKPPKYVKCDYELRDMLVGIAEQIKECDNKETRERLEEKLDKMRKIVDQAEGIPELFAKNMTKKDGKYIVFCKDKEHMKQMMEEAKKWFAEIDSKPEMYYVYSGNEKNLESQDGENKHSNEEQIKRFEESKSNHLKLLFSIDMLNEGLHVEDISGVIMLRPTDSRIIYLQQLGRALSSDKTREQTIVFDLVNNYLKNNLDREINDKRETSYERKEREVGQVENRDDYVQEDIDIFRIQGETKEFLELFEELGQTYLINARKIKAWMEERGTTKPPAKGSKDVEEKTLGNALGNIRQQLIKPYLGLKTEEAKEKYREEHPELEEVQEIVNWIDENRNKIPTFLVNAREIKKWMEERGTTKPPAKGSKDVEENTLGNALGTIRKKLVNPYLGLKTEEEKAKYREEHPELEEVLQIVTEIDLNSGDKKKQELAKLIRQDEEARKKVEEARKLEVQYEQKQKIKGIDTGENDGK